MEGNAVYRAGLKAATHTEFTACILNVRAWSVSPLHAQLWIHSRQWMRLLIFASGTWGRLFQENKKLTVSASSSFWMPLCPPVQNLCCVPCATHSTYLDQGAQRWCTCCYKRKSSPESSRPQRTTRCMAALVVVETQKGWQIGRPLRMLEYPKPCMAAAVVCGVLK